MHLFFQSTAVLLAHFMLVARRELCNQHQRSPSQLPASSASLHLHIDLFSSLLLAHATESIPVSFLLLAANECREVNRGVETAQRESLFVLFQRDIIFKIPVLCADIQ